MAWHFLTTRLSTNGVSDISQFPNFALLEAKQDAPGAIGEAKQSQTRRVKCLWSDSHPIKSVGLLEQFLPSASWCPSSPAKDVTCRNP